MNILGFKDAVLQAAFNTTTVNRRDMTIDSIVQGSTVVTSIIEATNQTTLDSAVENLQAAS